MRSSAMALRSSTLVVNKSNSTAGAIQVEVNLQEQLSDHLQWSTDEWDTVR